MSAHTPGPWLVFPQHHDRFKVGDYSRGKGPYRVLVDCCPDMPFAMNPNGANLPEAEALANARLIAAAPQMLEALLALCSASGRALAYIPEEPAELITAAIAAARGQS